MLEFKKRVLQKVSFDLELFEKELRKATKWLMDDELEQLRSWCCLTFGEQHIAIVNKCFKEQRLAS